MGQKGFKLCRFGEPLPAPPADSSQPPAADPESGSGKVRIQQASGLQPTSGEQ
jgi:hypothetical protein